MKLISLLKMRVNLPYLHKKKPSRNIANICRASKDVFDEDINLLVQEAD